MFEEVGEQYHQFIASSRISIPISLPFSLHGFDPFPSHQHNLPIQLQTSETTHINLPQLHHKDQGDHYHRDKGPTNTNLFGPLTISELEGERSITKRIDPWSSDEVLALHKIRSGLENWYPDFTWEYVSRKLEELGFKRSAENCKEKFEEESRHFNGMSFGKEYRLFNQLEALCQNAPILAEKGPNVEKLHNEQVLHNTAKINDEKEDSSRNEKIRESKSNSSSLENEKKLVKEKMKRKRLREFETLKGFCEEIVRKMMTQQEEMYKKIIEHMVKRDEENIAKEVAWKKQEMESINKEIEIRVHEQVIASERQTKLIEFLQKITSNSSEKASLKMANNEVLEVSCASISSKPHNTNPFTSSTMENLSQNPSIMDCNHSSQKLLISSNESLPPQNPSSGQKLPTLSSTKKTNQNVDLGQNKTEEFGKRWPREEVLALINLRGSINGNSNNDEKQGTSPRGPLWERISQGMLKMGYRRSAKRCKEKWENINKYFRKTKDVNKNRSIDSRTCPYFQQLSNLYSQGGSLVGLDNQPKNPSPLPENFLGSNDVKVLVDEGERDLV